MAANRSCDHSSSKIHTVIKRPARGLTVIAASVHGLLRPTCSRNHMLLASVSAEIKRQLGRNSEIWLRKAVDTIVITHQL